MDQVIVPFMNGTHRRRRKPFVVEPRWVPGTPDTLTVIVGAALADRVLNAAESLKMRVGDLLRRAIAAEVGQLEAARGEPFPERKGDAS